MSIREARRDRKNKHGHHDGKDNDANVAGRNSNKNKANEAAEKRRREVEERRKKQQAARANAKNTNKNNDKEGHHHGKKDRRRVTRAKFIRTKFVHNTANKGGAIWNSGSHMEVEDSLLAANKVRIVSVCMFFFFFFY